MDVWEKSLRTFVRIRQKFRDRSGPEETNKTSNKYWLVLSSVVMFHPVWWLFPLFEFWLFFETAPQFNSLRFIDWLMYSQTSLIQTPKGQNQVSALQRCPYYRGREYMIFGILGPNELSIVEKNFYRDLWLKISKLSGSASERAQKANQSKLV